MVNNKIPQEIEEKILNKIKELIPKSCRTMKDKLLIQKAISLSFEAGQKQKGDDFLKLIDEKIKHYKSPLVKSVRISLEELKAQIENGGDDEVKE